MAAVPSKTPVRPTPIPARKSARQTAARPAPARQTAARPAQKSARQTAAPPTPALQTAPRPAPAMQDQAPTPPAPPPPAPLTPTAAEPDGSYVVPVLHTHVPARTVNVAFWAGLTGCAALGVVDPPLAVLIAAGVVVARHQATR